MEKEYTREKVLITPSDALAWFAGAMIAAFTTWARLSFERRREYGYPIHMGRFHAGVYGAGVFAR
jgi:hypothetical protein